MDKSYSRKDIYAYLHKKLNAHKKIHETVDVFFCHLLSERDHL
jgi:hypothetical protein